MRSFQNIFSKICILIGGGGGGGGGWEAYCASNLGTF